MDNLILPISFFESLDIPEDQKTFIIQQRMELKNRFEQLQSMVKEPITTNVPATSTVSKPPQKVRKPRTPPPLHLRCVAQKKRKRQSDDPEQCKRANKLPKDAAIANAIDAFDDEGKATDLLYCKSHTNDTEQMTNIFESIREQE